MPAFGETWSGGLYAQDRVNTNQVFWTQSELEEGGKCKKTNVDMVLLATDPHADVDNENCSGVVNAEIY